MLLKVAVCGQTAFDKRLHNKSSACKLVFGVTEASNWSSMTSWAAACCRTITTVAAGDSEIVLLQAQRVQAASGSNEPWPGSSWQRVPLAIGMREHCSDSSFQLAAIANPSP
jgi:hypothetical protein